MSDPANALPPQTEEASIQHEARAALYRVLFDLLRKPPRPEALVEAAEMLEAKVADRNYAVELAAALRAVEPEVAQTDYGRLFSPPKPVVAARCKRPNCGVRDSAFNAADTLPAGERVSELHVLSVLAERTAQAFRAQKLPEAAAFGDAQTKLLSFHAGACLADLALELQNGDSKLYATIGKVLGILVGEDLKRLARS